MSDPNKKTVALVNNNSSQAVQATNGVLNQAKGKESPQATTNSNRTIKVSGKDKKIEIWALGTLATALGLAVISTAVSSLSTSASLMVLSTPGKLAVGFTSKATQPVSGAVANSQIVKSGIGSTIYSSLSSIVGAALSLSLLIAVVTLVALSHKRDMQIKAAFEDPSAMLNELLTEDQLNFVNNHKGSFDALVAHAALLAHENIRVNKNRRSEVRLLQSPGLFHYQNGQYKKDFEVESQKASGLGEIAVILSRKFESLQRDRKNYTLAAATLMVSLGGLGVIGAFSSSAVSLIFSIRSGLLSYHHIINMGFSLLFSVSSLVGMILLSVFAYRRYKDPTRDLLKYSTLALYEMSNSGTQTYHGSAKCEITEKDVAYIKDAFPEISENNAIGFTKWHAPNVKFVPQVSASTYKETVLMHFVSCHDDLKQSQQISAKNPNSQPVVSQLQKNQSSQPVVAQQPVAQNNASSSQQKVSQSAVQQQSSNNQPVKNGSPNQGLTNVTTSGLNFAGQTVC